jgi:thiopeptide-type bacteriocin biosynthesis protein
VLDVAGVAEAVELASPDFADAVRKLCARADPGIEDTRRTVLTMIRYLLRIKGRCTPAGLMAGVAPVRFGAELAQHWGETHHVVASAGAGWLADIIAHLEACPAVLTRLPVMTNTALMYRSERVIVPYRASQAGAADVSLRSSAPIRAALTAASAPIALDDLAGKIIAEFPRADPVAVSELLAGLVRCGALITSLHAPGTEADALAHLVGELQPASADAARPLREIHELLHRHNRTPAGAAGQIRQEAVTRMRSVAQTRQHPLAADLRLDATLVLPDIVAREAERAAFILTRLAAFPAGTPAWRAYHQRFYERYGLGSLVPVLDMVSDSGIGWPDGYPRTPAPEPARLSHRDEMLLALAQDAALDGCSELILTEPLIGGLRSRSLRLRPPPHCEIGVRVHATGAVALQRGDFTLQVTTVSRGVGVLTGRFLPVLEPADRTALSGVLAGVPCGDQDSMAVQLSFPPLDPETAHVARAPQVFPEVISVGEHRPPGKDVLTVADLAVGCDGRRMYLAVPRRGMRVEAVSAHALNLTRHTPPLARLLIELSRAQCAQVTMFDWGAAKHLPWLPRVRAGRTVLSPARWRLPAADLPGRRSSWPEWSDALTTRLEQRRIPRLVYLAEGDRRLPLDLAENAHRAVLRAHLAAAPHAVLTEAPSETDLGWCGGRPHEIVIALTATQRPDWPALPAPATARVVTRSHGHLPATSPVLLASLYGDIHRQDEILAQHLPDLLARFPQPVSWWYIRYRDPAQHIRLRVKLPSADTFGPAARTVSTWAQELMDAGLLREVRYPPDYPETGRWGAGAAWAAAEMVFHADSVAMLAQLRLPRQPGRQALAAAHAIAIAAAYTGAVTTGQRWLIEHVPAAAPERIQRTVLDEARQLADPAGAWPALRSAPGGPVIATAWAGRDQALAAYREHLASPDMAGIRHDDVLSSLLHVNFVRDHGIDFPEEATCLYLARAAALTAITRTGGTR